MVLPATQILRLIQILNAPFYISNESIHKDLGIPYVKEKNKITKIA